MWVIWRIDDNGYMTKRHREPVPPVAFILHGTEDAIGQKGRIFGLRGEEHAAH